MEESTTPVIPEMVAAEPVLVGPFDRYWLTELLVQLPVINGEVTVSATFVAYRMDGNQSITAPLPAVSLRVENVLSLAADDPDLAVAIQSIGQAVLKMGVAQGLLAPPALTQILP